MGFSVLDPVIFHNSSWHKQDLPCCRVRFIRVQNTEKGLEKCSKHPPARFFFYISVSPVLKYKSCFTIRIIIRIWPEYWSLGNKYAIEPGPLSLIEVGLLRVGYLISEELLFLGSRYFRDLTEATIFWWYFRGGGFVSQVYVRCCNSRCFSCQLRLLFQGWCNRSYA